MEGQKRESAKKGSEGVKGPSDEKRMPLKLDLGQDRTSSIDLISTNLEQLEYGNLWVYSMMTRRARYNIFVEPSHLN